jgi:hypothetical protein
MQHLILDNIDTKKLGKVSYSLNVIQIHYILLKGFVRVGVRLIERYNNIVNVDE